MIISLSSYNNNITFRENRIIHIELKPDDIDRSSTSVDASEKKTYDLSSLITLLREKLHNIPFIKSLDKSRKERQMIDGIHKYGGVVRRESNQITLSFYNFTSPVDRICLYTIYAYFLF